MSTELEQEVTPEVDEVALDQAVKAAVKEDEQVDEVEVLEPELPQYTEAEQKAIDMGWNPDPESLKDTGKQWIPAEEFIRNQSFFSEIKNLKKQVKQQQKVTEAFKEQNKIVQERAYAKAVQDLKAQKVSAAQDQDLVKMLEIDERIEELDSTKKKLDDSEVVDQRKAAWDSAYEDFIEQNSWYQEDEIKQIYADRLGHKYLKENPGVDPDDLYKHVITEVNKKFKTAERGVAAQEAVSTPKPKASAVADPTRSPVRGKSTKTMADVPEEHRGIAMTLIRAGELSEADYLKQYFQE